MTLSEAELARLRHRGFWLEYASMAWMTVEAAVAITSGIIASSIAFCAFTSAAALLGLGLNAWLGWWWADPAAALVIAALAVREGIETWEADRPHDLDL